jgi:hypothetical protein
MVQLTSSTTQAPHGGIQWNAVDRDLDAPILTQQLPGRADQPELRHRTTAPPADDGEPRMACMAVIPLGPAPAGRLGGQLGRGPAPGGCYGRYCSAIRTTWPSRTVIQNGGLLWVACITIASRHRGSRMSLVTLPV